MIKKRLFIGLFFLVMTPVWVKAQFYTSQYGQNRIQYQQFDWYYYSTTHFDVYYYPGGGDYANQAIEFLEKEFTYLTDVLGYAPYSKTKIFIYQSIHDLQQSNIGIEGPVYTLGGRTDFVKLQIEIAHPGSAIKFKEELTYKLSRILIEDMLFGGSLAEMFQSSYLLTLPRWFIDGAARYLAYGWNEEMDDYIRDLLSGQDFKKLVKIEGTDAGLLGQSIWNYIAVQHGRSNISNILNLTRIIRNEENSITSTLGMEYRTFLRDWQNYYNNDILEVNKNYIEPEEQHEIVSERVDKYVYKDISLSPNGRKVAYAQNKLGRYTVYVYDMDTEKTRKVFRSGIRVHGQEVDYSLPLVDWVDDDRLGVL
jgi:hypothetical protein